LEEEQMNQTSPTRNRYKRYKLYKYLTVALFSIVVFFSIGAIGVETTSSSKFCSTCHEMKPEFYTWKASSHSEVDCVQCHISPGAENYAKAKVNGLAQVYKKGTKTYTAPIKMPNLIPDETCEKCHNINTRNFTVSGDIIISHEQHKKKEIECIQCHSGTAHGKIADRKMTFQTDYKKWDEKTGVSAMKDLKFVKPDMDTCIDCHEARKVTNECSSCHSSGMIPESHKQEDFKTKTHGDLAKTDLAECNSCHKYMSTKPLKGYEEESVITQFLKDDTIQNTKKTQYDYAKENTYCLDCHNKRPASHTSNFFGNHGTIAKQNHETCSACHDLKLTSTPGQNQVNCSTCHPSKHSQKNWRQGHPVPVDNVQKPSETCYKCHAKQKCTTCHKD
jgi:nitrate/TMAO reductase-like tetraheme cytochrome c subunit